MTNDRPAETGVHAGLRTVLNEAVGDGILASFTIRKGGRSTLMWPGGTKSYTTGTLDTLTVLARRRAER